MIELDMVYVSYFGDFLSKQNILFRLSPPRKAARPPRKTARPPRKAARPAGKPPGPARPSFESRRLGTLDISLMNGRGQTQSGTLTTAVCTLFTD
jgi:hypothetical protein